MSLNNQKIDFLAGSKDGAIFSSLPFGIYETDIINFLSELSNQILLISKSKKRYRIFSYYALWSRKSNLLRLKKSREDIEQRFGRGLAFHIAPSNVSTNILFTMAFGLISGCPSIIRISSKNIKEINEIFKIIDFLLERKEFKLIKNYISIISYERDEEINKELSKISDLRVIWGGNETINYFKGFITKPKSIDIVYPNRSALAIISKKWLNESTEEEKNITAKAFSNDISLFSQRACSSPKQLIVYDEENELDRSNNLLNTFLIRCDYYISKLTELEEFYTLKNFKTASEISAEIEKDKLTIKCSNLFGIYTNDNSKIINDLKYENTCFFIREISNLSDITNFLKKDNQTIVQIGLNMQEKKSLLNIVGPLGTDRIVRAGTALNMNIFWDGYDTVGIMSRLIQF